MQSKKEVLFRVYKKGKESRRAHAILLFDEGHKISEIAKLFFVDEDTVRNWIKKWDEENNVEDAPRSGASPKITPEIEKRICQIVDENQPQKHGITATTWDCREIRIWLKKMYSIEVTDERIRQILKKNGFNYRKLNYKFLKADEKQKVKFIDEFKKLVDDKRGTLIFQDEMKSKLHPRKGRVWTRNKKPLIETNCSHEKVFIVGGVAPEKGKIYALTNERFNSNVFISFLRLLLSSIKGKILLIIDNHPAHCSKETKGFLAKHRRIEVIYLPKYSPELNPKENFWNYVRKKFLNNRLFNSVGKMTEEVLEFIKNIPKKVVKRICSYEYLLRKRT